MRSDEVCLREMISATEQLPELLAKPDTERLLKEDRGFRHSVFFEFVVIGEEVSPLSEELRQRHPGIAWRQISAFRNRIAHSYFELSLPIVWQLWTEEVPRLRTQLLTVLSVEFPSPLDGSREFNPRTLDRAARLRFAPTASPRSTSRSCTTLRHRTVTPSAPGNPPSPPATRSTASTILSPAAP